MAEERNWKSKTEARTEALFRVKSFSVDSRDECQKSLDLHLDSFLKNQKGRWGAYRSINGEASPFKSIQKNNHLHWAYPCVRGETLDFYLEPKVWLKGQFGIEEPDPESSSRIYLQQLEGYLVPGLGFDRRGTRLGRGRGYFDRALEKFEGLKVGVAFEKQVFEEQLPREAFDVPMDVIVTNRGIFYTDR